MSRQLCYWIQSSWQEASAGPVAEARACERTHARQRLATACGEQNSTDIRLIIILLVLIFQYQLDVHDLGAYPDRLWLGKTILT